jgi:hypothetical protein
MACSHCWALPFFSSWDLWKATVLPILDTSKGPFLLIFQSYWTDSLILMISNWSWKLISIYRFWFPISKTNLPNWAKFLISSLQFDLAKILFFKMILIQVDRFNLLIFNLQQFNLIHENLIQFDQILIRWKVQISYSPTLFNSTIYPNSWFPVLRP